jgi:hypothetical protein
MQPLPWDMIGAIFGVLSFILTLIIEWNRLGSRSRILIALLIGTSVFFVVRAIPSIINPPLSLPYDDFNNPKFDGTYNSNLWEYTGTTHVKVRQANGSIVFSTNDTDSPGTNNSLEPISPKSWKLTEFRVMESRLLLSGERKGQKGMIKIQAVLNVQNSVFFIECQLVNKAANHASFWCNFANDEYWTNNYQYEYETTPIDVGYNEWHTARFEINPTTIEIRYYFDNKLIGSFIPKDANILRNATVYPQIGSWTDGGENFIGYFDNVILGK